jgi:hypothetical protein
MKTFFMTFAVCITFISQAAPIDSTNCVLISGLVSWWPAESNAVDVVDSNTGVLLNGATYAPGKVGEAFSFNGTGAHVRIADNANLHLTNGLTVSAWVFPTKSGNSMQIISKWDVVFAHQKTYGTWINPSRRFQFSVCNNGDESIGTHMDVLSVTQVPTNQWTHVAATYDGATMKVYLNGQLQSQAAYADGIFAGTNDLAIGAIVGGVPAGQYLYPFSERIDEPAIYNRALSADEIQTIYLCQPPPIISLGLYPGLTINNSFGETVAIQYVTTVTSSNWVTITNLTVNQDPQLWIDTDNNVSIGVNPRRFYRAVVVP